MTLPQALYAFLSLTRKEEKKDGKIQQKQIGQADQRYQCGITCAIKVAKKAPVIEPGGLEGGDRGL